MVLFKDIEDIFTKISQFNEYSKALVTLATAVGAIVIFIYTLRVAYNLFQLSRLYLISQYCCQINFAKKYGRWAVISGSTDGIGRGMAKQLAARGMSILVIGRNDEKLAKTKAMLEEIPNVGEVETVKIDLSDPSVENFQRIREQIDPDNRDIGILINNAGIIPQKFTHFNRYDIETAISIVNTNVMAVLHLTRMIMPGMLERQRGLIVNVSSIVGSFPGPFLCDYAPTKSFLDSFTRQLQMEYASSPVDVILLTPGPVLTNILIDDERRATTKPSTLMPSADDYARSAINALSTRTPIYSGTMLHGMIREIAVFADSLGLLGFGLRLNRMSNKGRYDV